MPAELRVLRWVAIVVWCAILVLAATCFALSAAGGLAWGDAIYLGIAIFAIRELWDWRD